MDEPLEEQYFVWLYHQVASVRIKNPARTYWSLIRQLHQKEFDWFVPNDDNRVEDGRDLRYEFIKANHIHYTNSLTKHGLCSMLEMLIGLSRRLSFESEGEPLRWFWEMINNLELQDYTDAYYANCDKGIINRTLDRVIDRTYSPDGRGGLFPLASPFQDQREVEIFYQASAYLLERE
jgi:hypothetical protein